MRVYICKCYLQIFPRSVGCGTHTRSIARHEHCKRFSPLIKLERNFKQVAKEWSWQIATISATNRAIYSRGRRGHCGDTTRAAAAKETISDAHRNTALRRKDAITKATVPADGVETNLARVITALKEGPALKTGKAASAVMAKGVDTVKAGTAKAGTEARVDTKTKGDTEANAVTAADSSVAKAATVVARGSKARSVVEWARGSKAAAGVAKVAMEAQAAGIVMVKVVMAAKLATVRKAPNMRPSEAWVRGNKAEAGAARDTPAKVAMEAQAATAKVNTAKLDTVAKATEVRAATAKANTAAKVSGDHSKAA